MLKSLKSIIVSDHLNPIPTSVQNSHIYYTLIVFYNKKRRTFLILWTNFVQRRVSLVISTGYPIDSSEYGESGLVFKKYTPDALMKSKMCQYFKHFKLKNN